MLYKLFFIWIFYSFLSLQDNAIAGAAKDNKKKADKTWTPPYFDETLPNKIGVTEGQSSKLVCAVYKLRGRSVSWIRQKDLHVISANTLTFTSDDRFKVSVDNVSSSWTLQISPTLREDAGIYECQVNTRPKLSWPVMLEVEVPAAQLEGPLERYIQSGSTLVLTCNSTLHPDAISSVIWHHNGTAVNITSPRGGLSIQTDREGRQVVSRLSVVRATPSDAGLYMCAPDLVHPANATVFVVEGEHRAATHHDGGSTIRCHCIWVTFLLVIFRSHSINWLLNVTKIKLSSKNTILKLCFFVFLFFSIFTKCFEFTNIQKYIYDCPVKKMQQFLPHAFTSFPKR